MPDFAKARETMVDRQIMTVDVTDARVLSAMRDVPREVFAPRGLQAIAYSDADIPLKTAAGAPRRALLNPPTLARLAQLAAIGPDDIVLDVASGTGYGAAVLARLANFVVALEADADLATAATANLIELGIGNAAVVTGPFAEGYGAEAPYDVIFVEGSVEAVPDALTRQLKEGGRLVAVVGQGLSGSATIFTRSGDEVSGLPAFNAAAPQLPGFAAPRSFAF
ncbi:MAG: protein-L-isoaspartate O-methyltransferase [Bauldia sp.]